MDEQDFALSAGPGYKAALCPKCGQIKPLADFQRRMSRAYAASKGKAPGVGLVIDSSLCKTCQPKPKKPSQMTAKELKNALASGDLRAPLVEGLLKRRHEAARAKSRSAIQGAWDAKRMAYWDDLINPAKDELRRLQQQEKYGSKQDDLGQDGVTFFLEYKLVLTMVIARLKQRQRTDVKREGEPQPKPPHAQWQGYVDPTDWHKIRRLWETLPLSYRKVAKPPMLLFVHPTDAEPYQVTNKTLRKGPTAAQRLGLKKP